MTTRSACAVALLLSACAAACSITTRPFRVPTPSELPVLQAVVDRDITNVEAVAAVTAGYVAGGRLSDARRFLSKAQQRLPDDPTLLVLLGLLDQEFRARENAAFRFAAYLEQASGPLAAEVAARLDDVRNGALRTAVARLDRQGVEERATLDQRRIVVLPTTGLPATADLAVAVNWLFGRELNERGLDVVDRTVANALAELRSLDRGDAAGSMDVGRSLGAAHVVTSDFVPAGADGFTWTMTYYGLPVDDVLFTAAIPVQGAYEDMAELVERAATAVERLVDGGSSVVAPSVDVSAPRDARALLAFARGLQAVDAGDWALASTEFDAAVELEPSFLEAAEWVDRAAAVMRARAQPLLASIEEAVRVGEDQRAVASLRTRLGSVHQAQLATLGDRQREAMSEIFGLDLLGSGMMTLLLEPPAGGSE